MHTFYYTYTHLLCLVKVTNRMNIFEKCYFLRTFPYMTIINESLTVKILVIKYVRFYNLISIIIFNNYLIVISIIKCKD